MPRRPQGKDTQDGHYDAVEGEILHGHYTVVSMLGYGTFGRVFLCKDTNTGRDVAIKIIRAVDRYIAAGKAERDVLLKIRSACEERFAPFGLQYNYYGNANLAHLEEWFEFRDHICLVFPVYGMSALDLLKANNFRGFNLDWTRELSRSFLTAVAFFHGLGLIHTDIKPENIMCRTKPLYTRVRDRIFVHPAGAEMVLIDLGSAVSASSRKKPPLVCTRQYRPPEITLGFGEFSYSLDVWSCGCVMYELLTGRTLFRTHNSQVHLAMIERVVGPMPAEMYEKAKQMQFPQLNWYINGHWTFPDSVGPEEIRHYEDTRPLTEELAGHDYSVVHLIRSMLRWDPARRPTLAEIFTHPYFVAEAKETKFVQTV